LQRASATVIIDPLFNNELKGVVQNHLLTEKDFKQKLSQITVLKTLSNDVINSIAGHCNQHYFDSQEYLIHHNSKDKNVFFLISGRLRATITSRKGRELGYKEIFQGDMFGELSAIDNQPRSISVVAIQPSITAIIKQSDFIELLKTESEFSILVMNHLTKMVRDLSDKVFEFGTMNIQERFYIELLRMAQPYINNTNTVEIHPLPTHIQISNMIGANREAVTREMNILKASKLIELRKNRTLFISDLAHLEKIVGKILDR